MVATSSHLLLPGPAVPPCSVRATIASEKEKRRVRLSSAAHGSGDTLSLVPHQVVVCGRATTSHFLLTNVRYRPDVRGANCTCLPQLGCRRDATALRHMVGAAYCQGWWRAALNGCNKSCRHSLQPEQTAIYYGGGFHVPPVMRPHDGVHAFSMH